MLELIKKLIDTMENNGHYADPYKIATMTEEEIKEEIEYYETH